MKIVKSLKKLSLLVLLVIITLFSTKFNILAAGEDTPPYYDDTEDTSGFLDPIVTIALIVYVLGLILFLYGKFWERKAKSAR